VAGLLAIAVLGTVAVGLFSTALDARLAAVEAPDAVKTAVWTARHDLAGLAVPPEADPATRERLTAIVDRSFVGSFRWIMAIAAALGVGSALCAALTIPATFAEDDE
jgi:hypothetical protein